MPPSNVSLTPGLDEVVSVDPKALRTIEIESGALDMALGSTVAVSAAGEGRIRYNEVTNTFEVSENGGVYVDLSVGGNAFVQNGNSFGVAAVLGTNDAFTLSFETAGVTRVTIATTGEFRLVSLGTAALPVIAFTGDPNTGIFSSGADTLNFTTAGTERVRIQSNGRVAIGITAADGQLEVNGAIQCANETGAFNTGASPFTSLVIGAPGQAGGLVAASRAVGANVPFTSQSPFDFGAGVGLDSGRPIYYGGGGWSVPDTTGHQFYTSTTYTEVIDTGVLRMHIDSTGAVRVGATAAGAVGLLQVDGALGGASFFINDNNAATGGLRWNRTTATARAYSQYINASGQFVWRDITAALDRFILNVAGQFLNVSLGTAAAPVWSFSTDTDTGIFSSGANTVDISAGAASRFQVTTTSINFNLPLVGGLGSAAAPTYTFTGDTNTGVFSSGADTLNFTTAGTERARFTSTGTFQMVAGGAAAAPAIALTGDTDTGIAWTAADTLVLSTGGTARITINAAGKVTIPGVIDPTALELSGGTDLYFQSANGNTAAVSAASQGRIRYNSTSQTWQMSMNGAAYVDVATSAGAMAIGGTVTGGTTGSVLFIGAGPVLSQDNANLFWDDTLNRLGIGTTGPDAKVAIHGGSTVVESFHVFGAVGQTAALARFDVSAGATALVVNADGSTSITTLGAIAGTTVSLVAGHSLNIPSARLTITNALAAANQSLLITSSAGQTGALFECVVPASFSTIIARVNGNVNIARFIEFENGASDPGTNGFLGRNGNDLKYHDGTAARTVVLNQATQTISGAWTFSGGPIFDAAAGEIAMQVNDTVQFNNFGGSPSAIGRMARDGATLKFHDGVAAQTVALSGAVVTITAAWTFNGVPVFDANAGDTAMTVNDGIGMGNMGFDPGVTGLLFRNGANLKFHNGTAANTIALIATAQTWSAVQTFTAAPVFNTGAELDMTVAAAIQFNSFGDPTVNGRLTRNGALLKYHDGTAARTVAFLQTAQTWSATQTYAGADLVPSVDSTGNVGTGALRWSLIRGVTVTSGRHVFEDEKTRKDVWAIHEDERFLYIQELSSGEDVAKFDRDGNLYIKGEVRRW